MQINASNIPYLPSITCIYNGSTLSDTIVYIRNCIDTWSRVLVLREALEYICKNLASM